MKGWIEIFGAREHNLKNLNVRIPKNKLVVLCGVSGSGKSTLAFDTLFAEGQRRYVESLSAYARQFLGLMKKPEVERIEGLSPAIAIQQKRLPSNPRSTVGTLTEIYDYLRVLYARVGKPYCPNCGIEIRSKTSQEITEEILRLPAGTLCYLLAPVVMGRKGEYTRLLEDLRKEGFRRVWVDGEIHRLDEKIALERYKIHHIDLLVDRLEISDGVKSRVAQSVELALEKGKGICKAYLPESKTTKIFSQKFACPQCGYSLPEITPRIFSFNSPYGACPRCEGIGEVFTFEPEKVFDLNLSLIEGGIIPIRKGILERFYLHIIRSILHEAGYHPYTPLGEVDPKVRDVILYGTGGEEVEIRVRTRSGAYRTFETDFKGLVRALERKHSQTTSDILRAEIENFMKWRVCPECHGARLRKESLHIFLGGKNISQLTEMTVDQLIPFLDSLRFSPIEKKIADLPLKEIKQRLYFLQQVGLEYLTLNRETGTLSGGEAERIRLASQIGTRLTGVMYILDEPTIGLHMRDNHKLLQTLLELRNLGNTVIVVEHDENTLLNADYIIELGPGAGKQGGEVIATGSPEEIAHNPRSLTGQYLNGSRGIKPKENFRPPVNGWLEIINARKHNLKNLHIKIPKGLLVGITGVSGSGKSTLLENVIYEGLQQIRSGFPLSPSIADRIQGADFRSVVMVDQSPISKNPRSNPATYTKVFDEIRKLFAGLPESQARGYRPGRFSFNVPGGRCEACEGAGSKLVEMHFLPDVYVPCEACNGSRFNEETLSVRYKGKNIADVLNMTVAEALDFFSSFPKITRILKVLQDVGLDYIQLGQPARTLSGGESQRVKLASELHRGGKNSLYLLDEPTTGLHFADVEKLLNVLERLVEANNTVMVIEHNPQVILQMDWIIDLGPEGGEKGGYIVATGTPLELAQNPLSYTGREIARYYQKWSMFPPPSSGKKISLLKQRN
ncbi:MAG: excinuclease ABC subunit UvrA [bacterium JZ-2024 1]